MRKILYYVSVLLLPYQGCAQSDSLIAADIEELGTAFQFTEGPTAAPNGDLYFSDVAASRVYRWDTAQQLTLIRETTQGGNGLYLDRKGNLYQCQGKGRQVVVIRPDGATEVLVDAYEGDSLNSPNDVWLDDRGGMYFTDPNYSGQEKMAVEGVYYLSPDRKKLTRVIDDFTRPNGLVGTPDGKTLFVTDHIGGMTWRYRVAADGTLTDKKEFAPLGCDGITRDERGNVYLTNLDNASVDIYSDQGKLLHTIDVPISPTNVAFAGKNNDELFITARTALYRVKMHVKGQKMPW